MNAADLLKWFSPHEKYPEAGVKWQETSGDKMSQLAPGIWFSSLQDDWL